MNGPNKNTKILVMGFAVILTGMAVVVGLFFFHMHTIRQEDRINAELLQKNAVAHQMRNAAERRLFGLYQLTALDDFFERDALRLKMAGDAAEFSDALFRLDRASLSDGERRALEDILAAVRATRPVVESTMNQAVEEQWNPTVQPMLVASIKHFTKVHEALNTFIAAVEASTAQRHAEISQLREREMKVIPLLGVLVFLVSLGVGLFVIRREMSHTKILEQRVRERTNSLNERETHFRTIVETAADSIISTNSRGIIESFNPASERIFGYPASEVIGRSINMLMPMHDAVQHDGHVKNYIDGGKPKVIGIGRELRGLRKDGSTVPIWLAVNRMVVGGKSKFVGIISDISAQRNAEDEIRQLADDNEIVASILRLSLSSDDLDHTLQRALELILDRQNLDLLGKGAIFLNNATDGHLEMRAVSRLPDCVVARCRTINIGECLCGRAAATMETVEKTTMDADHDIIFPDMDDHGSLCTPINYGTTNLGVLNLYLPATRVLSEHDRRLVGSVTDALAGVIHRHLYQQELVHAKESAEFSSRTKTEFLANMSHELRTPLNAIIGYSEMMENEIFGPVGVDKYKEYLEHITSSGRHLYGLINDLLDVSRIETDEFPLAEEVFTIEELVDECVSTVHHRAELAGNHVAVADAEALPSLRGDKRRIKQVLINLLHNAIKFTPVGGAINITTQAQQNGDFTVLVTDTGIGIAAQDIETVFAMFGQVDGSLARKYDGAGLGLPLSRKLVEKHDGKLELQSAPNMGTTAMMTMPNERVVWN